MKLAMVGSAEDANEGVFSSQKMKLGSLQLKYLFPFIGCDISAELAICWTRQSTIGDKGLVFSRKMKLQLTNETTL